MDTKAFLEETGRLERLLYCISWSMLSNNDDCADAVQETLLRAWQARNELRDRRAFKPWITRIMINTCRDMLRQRGKQQWTPLEEQMAVQPAQSTGLELNGMLNGLSDKYRAVVVLHYLEGYRQREIADMLGIPLNTVKSRLMAARTQLQRERKQDDE